MGSCHINFMYVNSGIDKSLDVSISLTKQIPHMVQTEGLLCSYYPSGTAADRVGFFPQCQSFIPLELPLWSMLQSGSSWQSFTLLATEVSEVLKVINERYRPYVRFWLQIGFSIPVSKSFGTVLKVRSDIPF